MIKDNFVPNPFVVVAHQHIALSKKINDFDAESTWRLGLVQNTEIIKETDASYLPCFVYLLASKTTLLLPFLILYLGNSLVLKSQLSHCCLPCYPWRHFFQSYPFSCKFRLLMLK